jgi:hypothetical protein
MTDLETIRRVRSPRLEDLETDALLTYVDRSNPEVRALANHLERYVRASTEFREMVSSRCSPDVAAYWERIY